MHIQLQQIFLFFYNYDNYYNCFFYSYNYGHNIMELCSGLNQYLISSITMFPLYLIGLYNVSKTIQYNGNRIRHITLYNITCFHYFSINRLVLYDFLCAKQLCCFIKQTRGESVRSDSVHKFKTFLRHAETFFPFLRYFLTGAKSVPP